MSILNTKALLKSFDCKRISDLKKIIKDYNIPHLPSVNDGIISTEKAIEIAMFHHVGKEHPDEKERIVNFNPAPSVDSSTEIEIID